MVVRVVVLAPQPSVGRDGDQQACAGRADAPKLAQRADVVLDVLDHVAGEQQVEARVLERQRFEWRARDVEEAALAAGVDRLLREVDADRVAERSVLHEVAPGATARVEDRRIGRQAGVAQQRPHDPPAAAKPPVASSSRYSSS